jgi:hypothetical protein
MHGLMETLRRQRDLEGLRATAQGRVVRHRRAPVGEFAQAVREALRRGLRSTCAESWRKVSELDHKAFAVQSYHVSSFDGSQFGRQAWGCGWLPRITLSDPYDAGSSALLASCASTLRPRVVEPIPWYTRPADYSLEMARRPKSDRKCPADGPDDHSSLRVLLGMLSLGPYAKLAPLYF